MWGNQYNCVIISDFNVSNFAGYLQNDQEDPKVRTIVAPFGQVALALIDEKQDCWQSNPDCAIIWTQPHSLIASFHDLLHYQQIPLDTILKEVDEYLSLLTRLQDRVSCAFVPTWVIPSYYRGLGMIDMKNGGIRRALIHMNLRVAEQLDKVPNMYMLDTERWIKMAGKDAFNLDLWYMGKIAFGNEVFKEAVKEIKSALRGIKGAAKKLLVVDLDDTLWGGIVGEVGWENIKLGGHDPIGEAYIDFQRVLKALTNRGILLGIVSKNEEATALEAIQKHPEMVLNLEDFVGWRINWHDKAQNIVSLASELNLGLESIVFIDDNPVERSRVREALPEVFVPEWPEKKTLYTKALLSLSCFDTPAMSKEDLERTKMYKEERQRASLKNQFVSLEEWLKTLAIKVKIEELAETNLVRAAQLLNKTNQMNLSTRRMTEAELIAWAKQKGHKLWLFRVSDKFGDAGLTGLLSLAVHNTKGRIVDFILSCRVMGRKIEQTMLATVIKYAQTRGLDEIYAKYLPTPKNKPCLEFWKGSGFAYNEKEQTFHWKMSTEYPVPESITLEGSME